MEKLCEQANSHSEVSETVKSVADTKSVYDKAIDDPIEQEKIRLLEKTQLDNFSSIAKAEEESIKKGKQEGIKEGLEKMSTKGKKESLAEEKRKKAIEIARNMLSDNLPIDVVVKYTCLSIEEIKSL